MFAGATGRAFITTAHRGQHRTDGSIAAVPGSGDPQLTTAGIGRADVWVFDPANLGTTLGGTPLKIMTFFSDTPRALAVSPDRKTVYAAAFKSGNQTTTVFELMVCDGFDPNTPCTFAGNTLPGGNPGPLTNLEGKRAPEQTHQLRSAKSRFRAVRIGPRAVIAMVSHRNRCGGNQSAANLRAC